MFAEEIRAAIKASHRDRLPDVAQAMWKAVVAGAVSEAQAEEFSALIEARMNINPVHPPVVPRRATGSRPRTGASMERRRRWAASGRMPPGVACRFTLAEQAVLAVVSAETAKRGDCRLALDHIAAVAGVSRSTVRNALRQGQTLGLITIRERRVSRFRSQTNVVAIVDAGWVAWMRLARSEDAPGGGCKSVEGTNTGSSPRRRQRPSYGKKRVFEGTENRPAGAGHHQSGSLQHANGGR